MKRFFIILLGCMVYWMAPYSLAAQEIVYSCWFDEDYGTLQTGTLTGNEITLDVTMLSEGFHSVNVLLGTDSNAQSTRHIFYRVPTVADSALATTYSCWFDEDYSTLQRGNIGNGVFMLNVDSLSDGFHSVNVQYGTGLHSQLGRHFFFKVPTNDNTESATTYSCWFDEDYSTLQSGQIGNGIFMLDVDSLSEGFHSVNVQYGSGIHAQLCRHFFYRIPTLADSARVTTYSCWFDEDYSTLQTGQIAGGIFMLDVDSLREGFHSVNVQYGTGVHAQLGRYMFYKVPTQTLPSGPITYSCWFDEDYSTLQSGTLGADGIIVLDASMLPDSNHTVYVQFGDGGNAQITSHVFWKKMVHDITYSNHPYGTIAIPNASDTVIDGHVVFDSTVVTITATPMENCRLKYLIVNGDTVLPPFTLLVTDDVQIEAEFEQVLPDLHVTQITNSTPLTDRTMTVEWTVRNDGNAATPVGVTWNDYVWIVSSADLRLYDPDDARGHLATVENLRGLDVGESYTNSVTVTIPRDMVGNYFLFVLSDQVDATAIDFSPAGGSAPVPYTPSTTGEPYNYLTGYVHTPGVVTELVPNDNFFYKQIDINMPPLPDLVVTGIVRPANFYSGSMVEVVATVRNDGAAHTRSDGWVDALYVSSEPSFTESALQLDAVWHTAGTYNALMPDSSYLAAFNGRVPLSMYGQVWFYVVTNANNDEYEYTGVQNNIARSEAANVILTPPADLVVESVTVPSTVTNKSPFTITYEVRNGGLGAPDYTNWYDKVYLSPSTGSTDPTQWIELEAVAHSGSLAPGGSYVVQREYTLPQSIQQSQNYCIVVKCDALGNVFEYLYEDNNVGVSRNMAVTIYRPDFVIAGIHLPDTIAVGHNVTMTLDLENNGQGNYFGTLGYKLYFSMDSVFENTSSTMLAMPQLYTSITAGSSLQNTIDVQFPNSLADGNYYIHIFVNQNCVVPEEDCQNNSSVYGPVYICHRLLPDLVLANIAFPDTVQAGQPAQLSFDIVNNGETTDYGSADIDAVSFHTMLTADGEWCPVQIQTTPWPSGRLTVHAGDTVHFVQTVTIPPMVNDNTEFRLRIDVDNNVQELDENNNSETFVRQVSPSPFDLDVRQIESPLVYNTGDTLTLNWTVGVSHPEAYGRNVSRTLVDATRYQSSPSWDSVRAGNLWRDIIYLSADSVVSVDDVALGSANLRMQHLSDSVYTVSLTKAMPHNLSGNLYLIVVADADNSCIEQDRGNNMLVKPITGNLIPQPNLHVTAFVGSDTVTRKQGTMVYYTVENAGPGDIVSATWSDAVYCGGQKVATVSHTGSLTAGSSYTDSADIVIPDLQPGTYALRVYTDADNTIYEEAWEHDNSMVRPVTVLDAPSCDLIVNNVNSLAMATVGGDIHVEWSVQNIGAQAVGGRIKDAVYLSLDTVFDNNDVMIGAISYDISLGVNGSRQRSLDCSVQKVTAGNYYVLVQTNTMRAFNEDSFTNNTGHSATVVDVSLPILVIGQPEQLSMASGSEIYYRMDVESEYVGKTLSVTLTTDSVIPEGLTYYTQTGYVVHMSDVASTDAYLNCLYVSHEELPTVARNDYNASVLYASQQQIIIPSAKQGTYYIMASANTLYGFKQQFTLTADVVNFEILQVNVSKGSNTGRVTTQVTGALFDTVMDFRLVGADGDLYPASRIVHVSPSEQYVTFDLTDMQEGQYDIEAELPGGMITTKEGAFIVEQGLPTDLSVDIVTPATIRVGRVSSIDIEYANTGDNDLDVVGFLIETTDSVPISNESNPEEWNSNRVILHFQEMQYGGLRPGTRNYMPIYIQPRRSGDFKVKVYPLFSASR